MYHAYLYLFRAVLLVLLLCVVVLTRESWLVDTGVVCCVLGINNVFDSVWKTPLVLKQVYNFACEIVLIGVGLSLVFYFCASEYFVFLPEVLFLVLIFHYLLTGLFLSTKITNGIPLLLVEYGNIIIGMVLAIVGMSQLFIGTYIQSHNLAPSVLLLGEALNFQVTNFVFYNIRGILSLCTAFILVVSNFYLRKNRLYQYEFPVFLGFVLLSVWVVISTTSWMVLYFAIELQAMLLFVLIAWPRRKILSVNTALKYCVINFLASLFLLYGIIHIIFLTNSQDILFTLSNFDFSAARHHTSYGILWSFMFILIGFFIKIGFGPMAYWLPEIYNGLSIPVLMLFATIPKFGYFVVLLNVVLPSLVWFYHKSSLLWYVLFSVVALTTAWLSAVGQLNERRFLLRFLGWGSVINLSFIFLLIGTVFLSKNVLVIYASGGIVVVEWTLSIMFSLCLFYLFYYNIQLLLLLGFLSFIYFPTLGRSIYYFSDLQALRRHEDLQVVLWGSVFSFLSFLGLPPLLGFWGKFFVIKQLLVSVSFHSFNALPISVWVLLVFIFLLMLAGGFSYVRLVYSLLVESRVENVTLGLSPVPVFVLQSYNVFFIWCQVTGFVWYGRAFSLFAFQPYLLM